MTLNFTSVAIALFLLLNQVNTLNILAIFPYEGKSHFLTFKVYLQELVDRGHNLTVISYFPENKPNYHNVHLGEVPKVEDNFPVIKNYLTLFATAKYLVNYGIENCKRLVGNEQVQAMVRGKWKFDVAVVEQFNSDCALGVAHQLRTPVVALTSHVPMPFHFARLGIPDNPAYVPSHFLGGGTRPTLYQRVERTLFDLYFRTYYKYQQWSDQRTLAQYFDGVPPLEELARDIKFMLLYEHFSLTSPRLLPPNVIEVGGYHVAKPQPLTGDLKKFFDEAEQGVIYISFGSVVKISTLEADKKQAILDTIATFPQRFVLKSDETSLGVDKNKLYVANWLPQVDILAHPKTLAFISHAGMGGTTEAIHFGVPMITVPVFGDQPCNSAAVEESGFGVELDVNTITKEALVAAIKKVLNAEFRSGAKAVSRRWHDRPLPPLQAAVYWTEFAARHAAVSFRAAAADTPLYQHLYLDVAAVLLVIVIVNIALLKIVMSVCCRSKNATAKVEKKSKGKKKSKQT